MVAATAAGWLSAMRPVGAAEPPKWLGDDLPLPLPVKTPQDIGFKSAAERQYLIFNLMAGGQARLPARRLRRRRGEVGDAAAHRRARSADREGGDAVPRSTRAPGPRTAAAPRTGSRRRPSRASRRGLRRRPASRTSRAHGSRRRRGASRRAPEHRSQGRSAAAARSDRAAPWCGSSAWTVRWRRIVPPANQVVTQREKTFLPHVLAVPLGTTVQFRNDDRIYHNVFSIAKPNDFDAGIRATGATYTRTFNSPGAVEILCNIHSTMNGYVFVVDSPLYAKAQASGAFSIRGVAPGTLRAGGVARGGLEHHAQDDRRRRRRRARSDRHRRR